MLFVMKGAMRLISEPSLSHSGTHINLILIHLLVHLLVHLLAHLHHQNQHLNAALHSPILLILVFISTLCKSVRL